MQINPPRPVCGMRHAPNLPREPEPPEDSGCLASGPARPAEPRTRHIQGCPYRRGRRVNGDKAWQLAVRVWIVTSGDDEATTQQGGVHHEIDAHLGVNAQSDADTALWIDLSLQHLWNARPAAAQGRSLETELIAKHDHNVNLKLRGLAMMAVVSAVGFVESFINEIFLAVNEPLPIQSVQGIAPGAATAMKNLWNASPSIERAVVLDKYQAALKAAGKSQAMPKGDQICQRVQAVVDLRSALLHYKPTWQGSTAHHFQSSPLGKLPANPQLTAGPWFPNQILSADCAEWSCNVCVELVDEWSGHMGLTNPPDTGLTKGWPTAGL